MRKPTPTTGRKWEQMTIHGELAGRKEPQFDDEIRARSGLGSLSAACFCFAPTMTLAGQRLPLLIIGEG